MWLILTDLHLDLHRAFATVASNGLTNRIIQQIEVIQQVKRIARKHKVNNIFFLGDLFNTLSPTIPKLVYNVAFYLIQSLAEIANVYILVGNHDIFQNIHLFTPFTSIPKVKVIHDSTTIIVDGKSIDMIPWGGDLFGEDKAHYCFAHIGIAWADVGTGFVLDADQVPLSALAGYKIVLAGHYHTRQMMAEGVFHIGGVMATSFKDTPEDKGVFLLDPTNDKLDFIPVKSPKFLTMVFTNQLQVDILNMSQFPTDNYYRLLIQSDDIVVPEFGPNVIVEYDYEPKTEETALAVSEITDLVPIVQDFIDRSNTQLPKPILKEKAIELLEV